MKQKVSTSDDLLERLNRDGHSEQINSAEHIAVIQKMNNRLEDLRRDFKVKEMKSFEAASKSILTA